MSHPELRTPRLLLRPPLSSDLAALTAILREPAVARYWHSYDEERVRAELLALPTEGEAPDPTVLVIESAAPAMALFGPPGQVLGVIQYGEHPEADYRHASVDLFLTTRCHGQGLASEAIHAVLGHLIGTLGHHRIVIDPAADNRRAIRAYERVGFRCIGLQRQYERGADGTFHDGLLMELLACDYRAPTPQQAAAPAPVCTMRQATVADVPIVLPMMIDFNQGESIDWKPETGEAPLRHLLTTPELGQMLLFFKDAVAVGYSIVTYGYDLEFGGRDAFLTELYLAKAARGCGVGKWAMAQVLAQTRAAGASALHLQVRADNTPAQRLYRDAGFVGTTRHLLSCNLTASGST